MLTANLKNIPQALLVFGIGIGLAYVFGFYALFAHTAFEAVYWGGYFLGVHVLGNLLFNMVASFSVSKTA